MIESMTVEVVVNMIREALWMVVSCSAPMLLVSLIVGLIVSIFQTVTSIQEQTLTFVPKILAIFLVLVLCGSWIFGNLNQYTTALWQDFSRYIR